MRTYGMKRIVSCVLMIVLLASSLVLSACDGADDRGEWGAYYAAFQAFAGEMKDSTRYLCIEKASVPEENQKGLYDLLYEYCKDHRMAVIEGDWTTLYGKGLLNDDAEFLDGYLLSFDLLSASEDGTRLELIVSLRTSAGTDGDHLGGTVQVEKTADGWKATKRDFESEEQGKAGAYLAVFAYFAAESGMDGLKSIIALDPNGVEEDVWQSLSELMISYVGKLGYQFMTADWEGLKQNGYVDSSNIFNNGYLMAFEEVEWSDNDRTFHATVWMKEGDMRALGGIFTVEQKNGAWTVTDVKTMMS